MTECVICEAPLTVVKRALVAPFLAERIWNRKPFRVELVRCTGCGFLFYNPRPDDGELQRLYSDYRKEEYLRQRHASEPWYTAQFNEDLASPASYEVRRDKVRAILESYVSGRKIRRILDHGGDRGDLVAGLMEGAEPFVYDISGVKAAAGVTPIADPAACAADLIINSNVLEHVGFPRLLVSEILKAAPKDGLVYLEVPSEAPLAASRLARRMAQVGLMSVMHPGLARHVLRPASLYMMHEHINYYTEKSLVSLLTLSGASVIGSGLYASSGRAGKADMAWCLGAAAHNNV
ncbi:MAG: methyltransferase domain-containing protein [Terracidiphilus sp.]